VIQLGQLVRLYADPGSTPLFSIVTSGATPTAGYPSCEVTLTGQSVTVP
jgi:hypothetical protein